MKNVISLEKVKQEKDKPESISHEELFDLIELHSDYGRKVYDLFFKAQAIEDSELCVILSRIANSFSSSVGPEIEFLIKKIKE